jgi:hypothetical protein
MQWIAIVVLSILACVAYGIIHDQITARICVEYFTIGHPRIIPTDDPTALGIVWGIVATWWVGVIMGIPLATVSRPCSNRWRSYSLAVPHLPCLRGFSATSLRRWDGFGSRVESPRTYQQQDTLRFLSISGRIAPATLAASSGVSYSWFGFGGHEDGARPKTKQKSGKDARCRAPSPHHLACGSGRVGSTHRSAAAVPRR